MRCALTCLLIVISASRAGRADSFSGRGDKDDLARGWITSAAAKLDGADLDGAAADAARAASVSSGDGETARRARSEALNLEAEALCKLGRFAAAEEVARRSLAAKSENPAAYELLASAELHRGEFSRAEASASAAIALDRELRRSDALAYYLRASAEQELGKREQELIDIERAADREPARFLDYYRAAKQGKKIFLSSVPLAEQRRGGASPAVWIALLAAAAICGGYGLFKRAASRRGGVVLGGKYLLERRIGSSGDEMWEALDQTLGRRVAIKKLRVARGQAKEAAIKEARAREVYAVLDLDDGVYLVFELAAGDAVRG